MGSDPNDREQGWWKKKQKERQVREVVRQLQGVWKQYSPFVREKLESLLRAHGLEAAQATTDVLERDDLDTRDRQEKRKPTSPQEAWQQYSLPVQERLRHLLLSCGPEVAQTATEVLARNRLEKRGRS